MVRLKEKIQQDVYTIILKGKLMGGPETAALHNRVKELAEVGVKKIVLDLGSVKWLNSSGLGVLMACYATMKRVDGQLKLARVINKVESLMMITQLITIFKTYESVEEAVTSYQ